MIRATVLAMLVSSAAHADGVPWLKGRGGCGRCNVLTGDQGSVAAGLGLIGGVAFLVGRKRR